MKLLNFSKRDIKYFLAGMILMIIVMFLYDLQNFIRGFREGYKSVRKTEINEQGK